MTKEITNKEDAQRIRTATAKRKKKGPKGLKGKTLIAKEMDTPDDENDAEN